MFTSILYPGNRPTTIPFELSLFKDLNLDQIIESVSAPITGYDIEHMYYSPLNTVEDIEYRHAIFRELENEGLRNVLGAFIEKMEVYQSESNARDSMSDQYLTQYSFLMSVSIFCEAALQLAHGLRQLDFHSAGFTSFTKYLDEYIQSNEFKILHDGSTELKKEIGSIKYSLRIRNRSVQVSAHDGDEQDFSQEIRAFFSKFQGEKEKEEIKLPLSAEMNDVELNVVRLVSYLYPETFESLSKFAETYSGFFPKTIQDFVREIQFYFSWLQYTGPIIKKGYSFVLPRLSCDRKDESVKRCYDLALAHKACLEGERVVPNDYMLKQPERTIIVTGPNQGGKTTFARMFGQLHYLASLGLPVPAGQAALYLPDRIFTHFEREEKTVQKSGKLQDDMERMSNILQKATSHSMIIINEIYSTAPLEDAEFLGQNMLDEIHALDCLCVCVTFIDALAKPHKKTVSMVGTVIPGEPGSRTFRLERKPADGIAYAQAIAERHDLTFTRIKERLLV